MEILARVLFAISVTAIFGFFVPHYLRAEALMEFERIGEELYQLTCKIVVPNKRKHLLDIINATTSQESNMLVPSCISKILIKIQHILIANQLCQNCFKFIYSQIVNTILFWFTLFKDFII